MTPLLEYLSLDISLRRCIDDNDEGETYDRLKDQIAETWANLNDDERSVLQCRALHDMQETIVLEYPTVDLGEVPDEFLRLELERRGLVVIDPEDN